ncbi:MAG TPA: PAS domain S-box protein [Actinomycetota bacterium]
MTDTQTTNDDHARLEEQASSLLDALPDGIVVVDRSGTIVFLNSRLEDLSDYRRGELVGRPIEVLVPGGLREEHERHRAGFESGRGMRPMGAGMDVRLRRRRGEEIPVDIQLGPVDLNRESYTLAAVRDDSQRRSAHDALREQGTRLQAVIEAAPVLVMTMSSNGVITSLNEAFERATGWSREEWIGRQYVRLIHPDDVVRELERMESILSEDAPAPTGGARAAHEVRFRMRSGAFRVFEVSTAALRGDPESVEIVSIGRDVSERSRIEEAFRESEERFRRIFEEGPLGIALVDRELRVTDVNNAVARMTGRTREEIVGSRFPAINDPSEAADDLKQMTQLLRGEMDSYRIEKRFITASGEERYASITTSVVHDENAVPLYTIRIVDDITDRIRLQREVGEQAASATSILGRLTSREAEVLGLLAQGLSAPQMAAQLSVSTRTIESHLANTYRKLGVRSRHEAVSEFARLSRAVISARRLPGQASST